MLVRRVSPCHSRPHAMEKDTAEAAARQAWRRLILEYHPDKRPHDFDAWAPEKRREWTGRFHAVQRAYEAVEAHVAALEGR